MNQLVEELKSAIEDFTGLIGRFPEGKRGETLFDKWSLKDMLAHLIGWANHQIKVLDDFNSGRQEESIVEPTAAINAGFVGAKRRQDWDSVYGEFISATNRLISAYESISTEMWDKKIWPDKNTTLSDFIKIEIEHYKNAHGPQVEAILKTS